MCWLYDAPIVIPISVLSACLFVAIIGLIAGYIRTQKRLEVIRLQDSELIDELYFKPSNLVEEELFNRLSDEINVRKELLNKSEAKYIDQTEYFTMWMHQVKTPISAISLIAQSIEDEEISSDLKNEVTDISDYVDMVLNYLRLGSDTNDLVVEDVDVDSVIKAQLRKFSNHFFAKSIGIDYQSSGKKFKTDEKWLSFVIGQILSNALKYSQGGTIKIEVVGNSLSISDQGIGIAPEDLPRILEKGYTGYNGRLNKRSTGIGLYLVKSVCDMLGVEINIKSELKKGTEVTLKFKSEEIDVRD